MTDRCWAGGDLDPSSRVGSAFLLSVRPPTCPIGSLIPSIPAARPSCESGSPSVVSASAVVTPSSVVVVRQGLSNIVGDDVGSRRFDRAATNRPNNPL